MSIYDIDYNQQVYNLTPPHKRKPKILAILNALVYPIQWLHDIFFGEYVMGSSASLYVSGSTYAKLDKVIGKDKAVYQALQAVPTLTDPSDSTNRLYWQKVTDNFIGTDQRAKGNSQIIILQGDGSNPAYSPSGRANQNGLLNLWFGVKSAPWIYIQNTPSSISNVFVWGITKGGSSSFSRTDNPLYVDAGMPLDYIYSTTVNTDFTVWVPLAVFNALSFKDATRESIVRRFLDQYIIAGINYKVDTY